MDLASPGEDQFRQFSKMLMKDRNLADRHERGAFAMQHDGAKDIFLPRFGDGAQLPHHPAVHR